MKLEIKRLETKRLILRKALSSDAEAMFKHLSSDPEVCKYLSWGPHENVGASSLFIEFGEDLLYSKKMIVWYCEHKELREAIGIVSLKRLSRLTKLGEVGFCFGKAFWRQAYTTEAVEKVLAYAFSVGYRKIIAKTLKENTASYKFLENLGFKYEKTKQKLWTKDNTIKELLIYSIKKN